MDPPAHFRPQRHPWRADVLHKEARILHISRSITSPAPPEEWASFVSQLLNAQNQKILKEGVPIVNVDDQLAELTIQANEFSLKKLPILKALQIA
jgi:hypothetical protein